MGKNILYILAIAVLFVLTAGRLSYLSTTYNTQQWKTYTNTVGKFSIQYPSTWTVKEMHELSNREVDDPKEVNTTVLQGKEGEIILQWGPMGFGGGCDEKDHSSLTLKQGIISICHGVQNTQEWWRQIYAPPPYQNLAFGAFANGNSLYGSLMRKIFSTLSFTK